MTLPVPQTSPKDKNSFAFASVARRWPAIITNVIDAVYQSNALDKSATADKLDDGKFIIQCLSKLRHEMGRDQPLSPIDDQAAANVNIYNDELKHLETIGDNTWFTAPWLFAECYMYTRIRSYFSNSKYYQQYDPFKKQKDDTFRSSKVSVYQLAKAQQQLVKGITKPTEVDESVEIMFMEMLQMCLWGNATDLSLLVDLDYGDVQKLQAVGKKALEESFKKIIKNDIPTLWNYLSSKRGGRIDFVLDNAGYELYTDFILADYIVNCTPFADEIVFHPKTIPWFVSDVLPKDAPELIDQLINASDFFQERNDDVVELGQRWKKLFDQGIFKMSVLPTYQLGAQSNADFWCTPYSYPQMTEKAPQLVQELKQSNLVIFKGDLNYRKLTSDGIWDPTTSFQEALGPLSGQFPLLSLRTNKADVIVGLDKDVVEKMEKEYPDYRISGKFAVVSFDK
ncbi:DUF89-domain-containing protein [Wallemia mellicola]|uniref:Sugar phosphate phosphatase n=2 Tax=Wallemia mellicola TaxID=1708541 RepID=A0A4T0TAB9_9BASI|nr:DUF89-domain-containing protein [Wallemia mellicola CBS 633.66]TIB67782.1 hypothetical protein E3Q24_04040 [Wallemia mellicola]EIM19627.1 DUF89-domain-containing protein [Wallemia mellicola CBS 633.66]TIB70539.1 hypothetical protein E3Q23_04133 [Wallemia mellicola]TIB76961.1 DUF89-domain-containing protein [Wallemia mellicola]TIB98107.1 DUF89-domain-containing protein [Wallemia mellicola]|eukprot:XP_006960290.1 DUF89-domain-containing protein [Wallemia mellicola CBS 633.66]